MVLSNLRHGVQDCILFFSLGSRKVKNLMAVNQVVNMMS